MQQNSFGFSEADAVLKRLNKIPIQKKLRPESDSIGPHLSVHIRPVTQAILCRIRELASAAIYLHHQNKVISSAILTRAIFETVALHYHLLITLEKSVTESETQDALTKLKRAGLGRFSDRNTDKVIDAIKIQEFAQELCQIEPKMRDAYDYLSEIVHPNAQGLLFAYAKGVKQNCSFLFENDFNHVALKVGNVISFALKFYEINHTQMEDIIPKFVKLFKK